MGCYNQYKARVCSYTYTECKSEHMLHTLALTGLVTNYAEGGRQNGKGGQVRFYPLQKEGVTENVLAVLKGGGGAQKVLR